MSTGNCNNPANAGTVLLEGWGVKEGRQQRHSFKNWKRRFFVLRTAVVHEAAPHTHELAYFESVDRAASGAAPKGTVLLAHGETRVSEVTRKVGGKKGTCLLVLTPGQRDFCFAPEDARRAEWIKTLTGAIDWPLRAEWIHELFKTGWPLLAAELERSPDRTPRRTAASGEDGADAATAAELPLHPSPSSLDSSWPPEQGGPLPSLEATVRAVAGEAAALRATRPDDTGVRRAVEAADRAEASVGAAASSGGDGAEADAAEPGRDVAAAVLSLQGVDWAKRVETAMGKIDAQGAEFEQQLQHLREHGALPAEVREVALEQLLDAVGALSATVQVLLLQAEVEVKRIDRLIDADRLRAELRKLPLAVTAVQQWGLEVPRRLLDVGESELCSMPLAATDPAACDGARGGASVQRVIGALVVAGGSAALKHVAWVDFDNKGEPVFEDGEVCDRWGNRDITISRPLREVLDAPECANLATALRVYGQRVTVATASLVPKVLGDVVAYANANAEAVSHPDAEAALDELNKLSKLVPQPCGPPADDPGVAKGGLQRAMELIKESDADAPPPTALEHAVHKQQRAVAGSKRLYQVVSEVARGVEGHDLVVLPGGVKKLARTVFKSAVNYGCDLSRITDQVRCTVVATSLAGVAVALRGLMGCETVSVVRVKNRFAADYDATPAGGYVDLQTMVVFKSEWGGWVMGEVQLNLWSMLRIKENPEGGHKIFNFARAMRAYDEATYMHKWGLDDAVAARIAAGVLLYMYMPNQRMAKSPSALVSLGWALSSSKCRVQQLDLPDNKIGDSALAALASGLKHNTSVSSLSLRHNKIGDSGAAALADALKSNSSVSFLFMYNNKIGNSGAAALADALKVNTSVSELSLGCNKIGDDGAAALADALKSNTSVSTLDLRDNKIGDDGGVALADALTCNTFISELDMRDNKIYADGIKALCVFGARVEWV